MAEKYPDWTAENIKDYFQIIKLNAETTATMVGKEPDELLQALLDKVDNLFDAVPKSGNEKIAGNRSVRIKSKNKRGLIPSLFLYINRGSQGSDLGDEKLRKGYLDPIGTQLHY